MNTTTARANLHKTSLALAVVAVLCGSVALNADAATGAPAFATVAHATALRSGDAVMGALPMRQPIHIEVALKMRDRAGLDAFIAANATNQAQHVAPQAMTSDQFLASHAPTQMQAQRVADYLAHAGFTHIVIAPNRLLVSADGTAATARNAFTTTFAQVKTHDGRIAFANTDDVRIPASLNDAILSVVGLQTVHQLHTFAQRIAPNGAHTDAVTGHLPTEFSSIYGGGTGVVPATAAAIPVGIVTEGKLNQTRTDLITFATNQGLAHVSTQEVDTNGTSSDTANTVEWNLDSQDIVGMAGGQVAKLVFYNIPSLSNTNLTADFNAIVTANAVKIVNVSLGECETDAQEDGSAAAEDAILATAVAQGQTFSISTGDRGADECGNGGITPSWPAASQYVVAAAGTKLNASTTAWTSEVVWNEKPHGGGATGGSPSTFEPMPSWQTAFGVTGTTRGVADIAFDADPNSGSEIVVDGGLQQWGGTSLAAPIFSGFWARVLQQYRTIGFAAPVMYALPVADFHDVTSGNNDGAKAAVGYDFASGRGSMILSKVLADAGAGNKPPVANWTYAASGLTATFTDTSTDSDGSIAAHAWKFGDGSTATTANPNHTYAVDGSYTVTETVTDNFGAKATRTQTVVVQAAAGPVQLLGNPGFETGTEAPWTMTTPAMLFEHSGTAHSGNWDVLIGSVSSESTDDLSQEITIPSGKTSATFAFYVEGGDRVDALAVDVYSLSKVRLARLALYANDQIPDAWEQKTLDMTPYIGQAVILKFIRHNTPPAPGKDESPWQLDDITLTVQ